VTDEERIPAKSIGRNNLIWVERTGTWMRTREVTKMTSGTDNVVTGESTRNTQIIIVLEDGHELVFDSEELVRSARG
jgi:hypothetical protein